MTKSSIPINGKTIEIESNNTMREEALNFIESIKTGKPIRALVAERGLLTEAQIKDVFDLAGMTEPGIHKKKS